MAVIASRPAVDVSGLIVAAAAGDTTAFTSLVNAYHEDMRRVCFVVAGDDAIADEAVASAWAIAWRKLGSVRDPSRARAWLVSVAVNEARQLLRARKRRTVVEIPATQIGTQDSGLEPDSAIDSIDLRNALARLDPEDRMLLAMRYIAGFDATEIAYATGRSPSGTRARLGRLLHRLQKELDDG
jgi:RNA polymerase sigma-70 factor, ECF subfamily